MHLLLDSANPEPVSVIPMDPSRLARELHGMISERVHGRIRDLNVALVDGTIVLRGSCSSHHAKQLALAAALDALGDGPSVSVQLIVP
jgi:hypothetical protein